MNGQVGATLGDRLLELLDEEPLAADRGQAAVEDLVAFRRHAEELHVARRIQVTQERRDVVGLP